MCVDELPRSDLVRSELPWHQTPGSGLAFAREGSAGLAVSSRRTALDGRRHRVSRLSPADCLEAAPRADAERNPPPAKTTRKTAAATGHRRTRRAQGSRGRSCSWAGIRSASASWVKIDSIDARSGSDRRSARSARRRSRSWRYVSVTGHRWSACDYQDLWPRQADGRQEDRYPGRQGPGGRPCGHRDSHKSSSDSLIASTRSPRSGAAVLRSPCITVPREQDGSSPDSTLSPQITLAAPFPAAASTARR